VSVGVDAAELPADALLVWLSTHLEVPIHDTGRRCCAACSGVKSRSEILCLSWTSAIRVLVDLGVATEREVRVWKRAGVIEFFAADKLAARLGVTVHDIW